VISDRGPPAETGDVAWVAVGARDARNAGLVAVSVTASQDGADLFAAIAWHPPEAQGADRAPPVVAVRHAGATPGRTVLAPRWDGRRVASLRLALPGGTETVEVALRAAPDGPWRDDLPDDDVVRLERRPLAVHVDPDLPAAHALRVRLALTAALGPEGFRTSGAADAALRVVRRGAATPGGGWTLALEPVPEGAAAERAPPLPDRLGPDPLAADLTTAGAAWVYAAGAGTPTPGEEVVLGAGRWPVLLRAGSRLRLAPDPLRGDPPPATTPFFPILLANLVEAAGGRGVGAGFRADGVLDPEVTRPGRAVSPLDPTRLGAAPPVIPARTRPVRAVLAVLGLVLLGLLWGAPRVVARRRARHGRARVGAAAEGVRSSS
jgi:hypothetical protein